MEQVSIIGLDLAKGVFQVHGATADGGLQTLSELEIKLYRAHSIFIAVHELSPE
ncbi:hypothetical protein [Donghicola tyrosinivorans]|uniref:hypothetical protein n=1 Tax=Donghicola tyrosinivorans TaxID=1652492 RepID=UPI00147547B5|nr:hypothetical protein [Donghicola tyrosinivorans]